MHAFGRHGELHLRLVRDGDVRVEVHRVARSIPVTLADQRLGLYQSLKVAIAPRTTPLHSTQTVPAQVIAPLPMFLL